MSNHTNTPLFNSYQKPIPGIRPNLDIIPIEHEGKELLYFHDSLGYATSNFALERKVGPILSFFDGSYSINDLKPKLGDGLSPDHLLQYVQFLDEHRILHSDYYRHFADQVEGNFEQQDYREATSAGISYPDNAEELRAFLDQAFEDHNASAMDPIDRARAVYAPHIDPRVGMETYVKAFAAMRKLKPKRVVLLATSHYAGLYPDTYPNKPFIGSDKTFQLPHGNVETDKESLQKLQQSGEQNGFTLIDRAHRIEHSIELHLLFLRYIWEHDFELVPILVGSFDQLFYMPNGHLGKQVDNMGAQLNDLFGDDPDTLFLVSGDLAHTGKKFGDEQPAASFFDDVEQFDKHFMDAAREGSSDNMLQLMTEQYDPYRICGFPPVYTLLRTFKDLDGTKLAYQRWDERERESAVTFGAWYYE